MIVRLQQALRSLQERNMKVKENYIAKRVLENDIVIDISGKKKNLIKLNETAAFMFEKLKDGIELDELIKIVVDTYEIDITTAKDDVNNFVNELKKLEVLDD